MSLSSCYAIKLTQVKFPQAEDRKRKQSQEDKVALPSTSTLSQKRPRVSPPISTLEDTGENAAVGVSGKEINPLESWAHAVLLIGQIARFLYYYSIIG
jgi:hypothetical protein